MEGNRIVSLQSDRHPLQEEAGFARIARSGCSRPPSSVKKLTPSAFIGPRVSIAMATKSSDCLTPVYFVIFLSEASSAAAPLTADVLGKCEGAKVSGTVTSHAMDLPRCHGMSVHPSTRYSLPSRFNPLGSFFDGILAFTSAL